MSDDLRDPGAVPGRLTRREVVRGVRCPRRHAGEQRHRRRDHRHQRTGEGRGRRVQHDELVDAVSQDREPPWRR